MKIRQPPNMRVRNSEHPSEKYGVNNMKISRDKVFISLSYSPRTATLKRKVGNLPVHYMRVRIDMEEDF
nr:unnamed protein product [Callosobruchus analis]